MDLLSFYTAQTVIKRNVFIFSLFFQGIDWEKFSNGITVILSPGDVHYAKDHGVAKLGKDVSVIILIIITSLQFLFCLLCSQAI